MIGQELLFACGMYIKHLCRPLAKGWCKTNLYNSHCSNVQFTKVKVSAPGFTWKFTAH